MVKNDWILKSGHSNWFWVFFISFCCLLHLTVNTSPSSIFESRYNLNNREHSNSNLAICTKLRGNSITWYATLDSAFSTGDLISVSFARELITLKRCRSIIKTWNFTMKISILIWNFNCSVVKFFPKPVRMTWHNTDAVWWKSGFGF